VAARYELFRNPPGFNLGISNLGRTRQIHADTSVTRNGKINGIRALYDHPTTRATGNDRSVVLTPIANPLRSSAGTPAAIRGHDNNVTAYSGAHRGIATTAHIAAAMTFGSNAENGPCIAAPVKALMMPQTSGPRRRVVPSHNKERRNILTPPSGTSQDAYSHATDTILQVLIMCRQCQRPKSVCLVSSGSRVALLHSPWRPLVRSLTTRRAA
jgi:hypothetical protein